MRLWTNAVSVPWLPGRSSRLSSEKPGGQAHVESGNVFTMENGRAIKPDYVTRTFEKLRVKAGLPKLTFHGQLHQAASLMLASNADLTMVSRLLGHKDTRVTSDLYSHLLGSKAHQIVANAAALVPPNGGSARTLHAQQPEDEDETASAGGGNGR